MKRVDKHLLILANLDEKICNSSKKNKRSYTDELNLIIESYYKNKDELEKISYLLKDDTESISKRTTIILELLKQIYADLNFKNIKDVKTSYAVNEFLRKIRGDKFDD